MKKIFFAALAAVALTACVADVVTEEPTYAIDFVSSAQGTVKTTVVDGTNFDSFQVYAFNGENVIMDDMEVTKEGSAWTYSPKKYWPATGEVNFFGVYMDGLNQTTENYRSQYSASATHGLIFGLEMAVANNVVDAAKIPDAVYATAIEKEKEDGAVHMNFRHAMAQIDFQIKNATTASNEIVVESGDVYVDGLYYSGNYTAPKTISTTEDTGIGSWNYDGNPKAKYLFKSKDTSIAAGKTFSILSEPCMALPQAATDDLTFVLNCTIKQKNDNGEGSVVVFQGEKTATVSVDWNEGYKYTYTFALYDNNLTDNEIKFTAEVQPITPDPVTPPTEENI